MFSNRGGEGVVLYRGLMTGGYAAPELLGGELDMEIRAIELGDVTGDGHPDVIAGGMEAQSLIFVNDGQGGFERVERFGADTDVVFGLALADFNQDGRIDIAVANVGVRNRVYFAAADGFTALEVGDEASDTYNLSVGDLNDDGRPDIVYAVSEGSNYSLINRIEPD